MNWDHVKIFLVVAEGGSLTAASTILGISPPTIARHIARLEQQLGAPLFVRRHDGYRTTRQGGELMHVAITMRDAADGFGRQAAAMAKAGRTSIRLASGFWFSRMITEKLADFHADHPEIEIELVTGHAIADLDRGDADISIRNMRPSEGNLVMRKLGDAGFAVYGSTGYVAANPAARSERRFADCDWIGATRALEGLASQVWLRRRLEKEPVLKCSQTLQFLDAAKSGIGLAILPQMVGDRDPELVRVSETIPLDNKEMWLVVHEHMRNAPAVRAVINWLVPLFRSLST